MSSIEERPEKQSAGWPSSHARGRSPQRSPSGAEDRLRSRDRAPLPSEALFNEKPSAPVPASAAEDDDDDVIAPSLAEATAAAQGATARVTRERETDKHRIEQVRFPSVLFLLFLLVLSSLSYFLTSAPLNTEASSA